MTRGRIFDPAGVAFGVVVPLAAAGLGLLLTGVWQSRLPAQIATHWSTERPDGFSHPMSSAWLFTLIILLIGGGCCGVAALAQALLLMRRAMLLIGLSVVGVLSTLQVVTLWIQLDKTDVSDVELPWAAISVGVLIGCAVGALGAAFLKDYRDRTPAAERPDAKLPRSRAHTVRDVAGFGIIGTIVFAGVAFGAAGLASWAVGGIWPLVAAFPVVLVLLALMRFEVIVDASGLRVRNFGLTSIDIDIDEVTGAKVIDVNPFKDFGGWGLRSKGHRRYGIVTHTGPGVEVATASGLTLTVTSQRAHAMAGALNSFADNRTPS